MTRFLFVRHTAHDWLAKGIAGRQPGIHLNSLGEKQAEELGARLSILPIDAIYCSPLERARETAAPLARKLNIEPQIAEEFNEVDMGEWDGKTFAELDAIPQWKDWNTFRSVVRPPGGELMIEVQRRVLRKIDMLQDRHRLVAIFSHGDVIRGILAHFLAIHLDNLLRFEIDPGGASLIELHRDHARVRFVNALMTADAAFH